MRKIFVSILLSTAVSALVASGAHAKEVKLSGIHTQDQVRAACKAVGGVSYGGYGGYGCINKSKGTQVTCTPGGQCTGEVPGRINPGTPTIMGVIAGSAKPVKGSPVVGGVLGAGILESGTVLGTSGPAAAGSPAGGGRPAAAPSAPPVIIR
jgi:hypothetical protein